MGVWYEFFPYLVDVDPDEELPEMEELLEMNFNDIMEVMGIRVNRHTARDINERWKHGHSFLGVVTP